MVQDRRFERKYVFPAHGESPLLAWLEHACCPDPMYGESTVSSIYYDTPDLEHLRQKRDGEFERVKLRLRWYGTANGADHPCYLELKIREGGMSRKVRRRIVLPGEAIQGTDHPQLQDLPALAAELGFRTRGLHVPMALIRYRRRRFREGASGARISVDTGIRCLAVNTAYLPCFTHAPLGVGVLEIKTARPDTVPTRILGPILRDLRCRSFSKYAECLEDALRSITLEGLP